MQLPNSRSLEINRLASVFDRKTATYKFYWFISLLEFLTKKGKTRMSFLELVCGMIAESWYPIHYFKLSFGKSDKLFEHSKKIQELLSIPIDINKEKLLSLLLEKLEDRNLVSNLRDLYKYVPFCLLTDWVGVPVEKKELLIQRTQSFYNDCLYSIEGTTIIVNPNWIDYLTENYQVLKEFAYWNLTLFLQKRNPNVPDIPNKLIKPVERQSLTAQRELWNEYISSVGSIKCIYTNKVLYPKHYDLDHFIPWSYVADNMFWDLIPADSSINSSKSNNLPDLNKYLPEYAKVHHKALSFMYRHNRKCKMLEDYLVMNFTLSELINLSEEDFYGAMRRQFSPMVQIAENMGFKTWRI